MKKNEITKILDDKNLKKTTVRVEVMKAITSTDNALSQPSIEKKMKGEAYRVTVYRVLKDLEAKGLIHKTYDKSGTALFSINDNQSKKGKLAEHAHVYFYNTTNKKTTKMENMSLSGLKLPKGIKPEEVSIIVSGKK
jgi:Fur family transcriptional regulator, ferric uptake regulator